MSNHDKFKKLKNIIKARKEETHSIYAKISTSIIRRDLNLLFEDKTNLEVPRPDYYIFENSEYSIREGYLDIIDRSKGEPFGWGFEIELLNTIPEYRLVDSFTYKANSYSVLISTVLENMLNDELFEIIENVINQFDVTINYLQSINDISACTYKYYSAHEDIYCSDIFHVYETVKKGL